MDRAAREEAEEAFPQVGRAIESIIDEPLRALSLEIDYDSWLRARPVMFELVLSLGLGSPPARFLIAPYIEGGTWDPSWGIAERAANDFFASEKARVDARFLWGDCQVILQSARDGTDLSEQPLALNLELDGRAATGAAGERQSVTRFELPSLRQLFAQRATFSLWDYSGAHPVQLPFSEVGMRLVARVRSAELFGGVCIWQSPHEREESALFGCPTLASFETQIQREVWLGAYLRKGLRGVATSHERRRRLAESLDNELEIAAADRWAAFQLLMTRARSAKLRRTHSEAVAAYERALSFGLDVFQAAAADYGQFFRVWDAVLGLLQLLREREQGEALKQYSSVAVGLARSMFEREPAEPDYARAMSQALLLRAELSRESEAAVIADLKQAATLIAKLARARPDLAWRRDELEQVAESVASLWPEGVSRPDDAQILGVPLPQTSLAVQTPDDSATKSVRLPFSS